MDRKFNSITQLYNLSQQYDIMSKCNSLLVTNIGGDPVTVDGKLLLPGTVGALSITSNILGDSFAIGGNENEIYNKRTIVVKFAGTGANPLIEITQKYFE